MRTEDLMPQGMPPHVLHIVDTVSAAAVVGVMFGALPKITAVAAFVWYAMQIYDWCARKYLRRRNRHHKRRAGDYARH